MGIAELLFGYALLYLTAGIIIGVVWEWKPKAFIIGFLIFSFFFVVTIIYLNPSEVFKEGYNILLQVWNIFWGVIGINVGKFAYREYLK